MVLKIKSEYIPLLIVIVLAFGFGFDANYRLYQIVKLKSVDDYGRYQLMQGSYLDITDKGGVRQNNVLKIDTKTGNTWQYYSNYSKGQTIDRWVPIGNQ